MVTTEQTTEAPQGCYTVYGLPVDTRVLFSDKKGMYRKGIEKRKMKLLQKVAFLARFLDPDEQIIFIATGCSPFSVLDHFTTGQVWLYMLKRSLFVFTTKRLFHIPTTMEYQYRGSIAQVLYEDLKSVRVRWGSLELQYHSGRKEKFNGIPTADAAIIKRVQIDACDGETPSAHPDRNHLCPNCTQVLAPKARVCPSCGQTFKNEATARLRSILIPGGGYFYTNHPFIGMGDALAESCLIIGLVLSGVLMLQGDPEAVAMLIPLVPCLLIEKLVTIYHANRFLAEFIPEKRKAVPVRTEAPVPPPVEPSAPEQQRRPEDVLSVR